MSETQTDGWWVPADSRDEWPEPDVASSGILDAMSDPFYVYDRRGVLLDWNDAFRELVEYSDAELADVDPIQFIGEETLPAAERMLARVGQGEAVTVELAISPKEAERSYHEVTATPLTDDDGDVWGLVGTARDVTQRREREQTLERYEQLIETVGDGVYVLDDERRFVLVNDVLCDLLGYEREELVGKPLTEVVTPESALTSRRHRELLRRSDNAVSTVEGTVLTKSGEQVPVESRFSLLPDDDEATTMGLVRDISDRKERAGMLRGLHEGTRDLMAAETVADVVDTAVEVAQRHFGYATAAVRLLRNDRLETVAVGTDDERLDRTAPPCEVGEGLVGRVYERRQAAVYPDLSTVDTAYDYGPARSALVVPMDEWGVVSIASTEQGAFDDTDFELARQFAADVRLALERADRQQRVREQNADLAQYETLVETMSDGVYMTDENNRLTAVNEAAVEMTGYDREELLGEPASVVLDADRKAAAVERRRQLRESGAETATHETVITTADGGELPIENRFSLLPGEGFQGTVGVIRDVTERTERERRLREVKERLDLALEGAALSVWDWDVGAGEVTYDERWPKLLGYDSATPIEAGVASWQDGVHEEDLPALVESMRSLLRDDEDEYAEAEFRIATADGEWRWIQTIGTVVERADDGTALRAVGVNRDVTEREERERRLREVKERLDLAIDGAELAIWDWNPRTGEVAFNDRWATMLGYDPDELGSHEDAWEALVHPGDIDDVWAELDRLLAGEIEVYEAEYRMRTADGGWMWIRDIGKVFERAEDGAPLRAVGIHQDVTERTERERELERYRSMVDAMNDSVAIYDAEGRFEVANEYVAAVYDATPADLRGRRSDLPPKIRENAPEGVDPYRELVEGEREELHGQCELEPSGNEPRTLEYRFTRLVVDGELDGLVGVCRDVTERKRRTDRLEAQRDELETLNRINGLVQQTLGALVSAASREDIEETVCEHLGGSSLYRFVFVGARRPGDEYVETRTWAGEGESYLEAVSIPANSDVDGAGPAARTFETGEVTVTHDVEEDSLFEPFREPALEYGFRSVAVVPLSHGGVVHGVLVVYADRPGAFSDREVQAFEVLGELVGFAISAAQDRRLIEADDHVELRFRLSAPSSFLGTLAGELGAECRLLGAVQTSEGGSLQYVAVDADAADPATVRDVATAHDHCTSIRHLRTDDAAVFEVRLTESVTTLLRESGVDPASVEATGEDLLVTVEAPHDVQVRRLTSRLEATYADVTLVSKQETDRVPDVVASTPPDVVETLTERQRAALTAAYFGGYFDWPRDSTAEEVAESLGISSPTLHQHLRHAQRKLLDSLLDERGLDS